MMSLKAHRRRAVLSTRELAVKAGVSPDTIWRIEGGDYQRIQPATMRRIADALGVPPHQIAEFAEVEDDDMNSQSSGENGC